MSWPEEATGGGGGTDIVTAAELAAIAAIQKSRVFLSETAVNPTTPGSPTLAEITTAASGLTDLSIYYTGTDTSSDPIRYSYLSDKTGLITPADKPSWDIDGALTDDRILDLAGSSLFIDETTIKPSGINTATEWLRNQTAFGTLADGLTVDIDLSATGFVHVDANDVSSSAISINSPTNIGVNYLTLAFTNPSGSDRNIIFSPVYKNKGNVAALGSLVLLAGETRLLEFALTGIGGSMNLVLLYDTGEIAIPSTGGITQVGSLPAGVLVGNSFYLSDSIVNSSLPVATGSLNRIYVSTVASGIGSNISGASNTVNQVSGGSYTTTGANETILFVDDESLNWSVQVLGKSSEESLPRAKISQSQAQAISFNGDIDFDAVEFDTGGIADLAGNRLVVVSSGVYTVTGNLQEDNGSANDWYEAQIQVNGIQVANQRLSTSIQQQGTAFNVSSGSLDLLAGDAITLHFQTSAGIRTLTGGAAANWLSITKVVENNVVLAGMVKPETLDQAIITRASGQSIPQSTATLIEFDTIGTDLGNMIVETGASSGITVAESGLYHITAKGACGAGGIAFARSLIVSVNGSSIIDHGQTETAFRPTASETISLVAGDKVTLSLYQEDTTRDTETLAQGVPTLSVRQLPISTIVNPEGLIPETLDFFSANSLTPAAADIERIGNNLSLSDPDLDINSDLAGMVVIDPVGHYLDIKKSGRYEITFLASGSAGTNTHIAINGVSKTTGLIGDTTAGGGGSTYIADLLIGDKVEFQTGSDLSRVSLTLNQLSTKTVQYIENGVEVSDAGAFGFRDIGSVRECWGTGTSETAITFPAPFANIPVINVTPQTEYDKTGGIDLPTATGFLPKAVRISDNLVSVAPIFYHAIGLKP